VVPSVPGIPIKTASSFSAGTIDFKFAASSEEGGWPVTHYEVWIDDGAGNWGAATTVALTTFTIDTANFLNYQATSLTPGSTYGIRLQSTNPIGTSHHSPAQYFPAADLPSAPTSPPTLDSATQTTATVAWNGVASTGGAVISGYRVYMNELMEGDWKLIYDG